MKVILEIFLLGFILFNEQELKAQDEDIRMIPVLPSYLELDEDFFVSPRGEALARAHRLSAKAPDFYYANPSLAAESNSIIHFPYLGGGYNDQAKTTVNGLSGDSEENSVEYNSFFHSPSKRQYYKMQAFPSVSIGGFSVALLYDQQKVAKANVTGDRVESRDLSRSGIGGGFAWQSDRIILGAFTSYIMRSDALGDYSKTTVTTKAARAAATKKFVKKYQGLSTHLGLTAKPFKKVPFYLAAVLNDVTYSRYQPSRKDEGELKIPQKANLAFGFKSNPEKNVALSYEIDVDSFNSSDLNIGQKLRQSLAVDFLYFQKHHFFSLLFGYYYPAGASFGAQISTGFVNLAGAYTPKVFYLNNEKIVENYYSFSVAVNLAAD